IPSIGGGILDSPLYINLPNLPYYHRFQLDILVWDLVPDGEVSTTKPYPCSTDPEKIGSAVSHLELTVSSPRYDLQRSFYISNTVHKEGSRSRSIRHHNLKYYLGFDGCGKLFLNW
ncbi:uncharacterized protein Bfra_004630, partial [Botrytis fragariae]